MPACTFQSDDIDPPPIYITFGLFYFSIPVTKEVATRGLKVATDGASTLYEFRYNDQLRPCFWLPRPLKCTNCDENRQAYFFDHC